MTDLLDMMREPPIVRPVDPDGSVVQGRADERIFLERVGNATPYAEIELHQSTDGLWMWSTEFHIEDGGMSYRVGEKWGRFARTRDDALYWAAQELIYLINRRNRKITPLGRRVVAWAKGLA